MSPHVVLWPARQEINSGEGSEVSKKSSLFPFLFHDLSPPSLSLSPSSLLFSLIPLTPHVLLCFRDMLWCPTENLLAYWVPETTDIPAKITVLQIPSRTVLSTKSKMLVKEVSLGKNRPCRLQVDDTNSILAMK